MMERNGDKKRVGLILVMLVLLTGSAWALPQFHVYIKGATARGMGQDEDPGFSNANTFNLIVVGVYGPKTIWLTNLHLVVSVPQGERGTLSIQGGAALYKTGATADILTDVAGFDGYDRMSSFDSSGLNSYPHHPYKDDVSDFIIFSLGDFSNIGRIPNYDVDNGVISSDEGEEKTYSISVSVSGFSWTHFDVYALETVKNGSKTDSTWVINPCSNDTTDIPTGSGPGALFLGGFGILLVNWLRRRGTL